MVIETLERPAQKPATLNKAEVRNLSFYYGDFKSLKNVSMPIEELKVTALIGPSGCGKSTLLSVIAGLVQPTRGSLELESGAAATSDIGYVFQDDCLLEWRTILENVLLPVELRGLPTSDYVRRAKGLLTEVGLEHNASSFPHQLSGGMRQRASICRALVCDSPILLMDEPFGALDAMSREKQQLLLQLIWMAHPKTVMFITHDIPEAVLLSDRVLVMGAKPGRLLSSVEIPLPRKRSIDMMTTPAFNACVSEVRRVLQSAEAA